jgi:hypothetical protein
MLLRILTLYLGLNAGFVCWRLLVSREPETHRNHPDVLG